MAGRAQLTLRHKELLTRRMAALANKTRLDCVLLLIEAEPDGMLATAIANKLHAAKNTMSANFRILKDAGLIVSKRDGRVVRYRAKIEPLVDIMTVLFNCCGGRPVLSKPHLQGFAKLMAGNATGDSSPSGRSTY